MRTITAVFLLFAAALLPAQAARGAYDRDMSNVPEGERIFQEGYGSLVLECRASIVSGDGEESSFHLRGVAFPLAVDGRTLYLAAGHVFDLEEALSTRGVDPKAVRVGEPSFTLVFQGRAHRVGRVDDGSRDAAVFAPLDPPDRLPPSFYPCGDSDELRPGSPVLSWGMPLMEGYELSAGIVSALAAPRSLVDSAFPGAQAGDFFVTSMPTIFGCSGAPVYAFRAGRPEIVGMLVAGYLNMSRSIVYRINAILRDAVPR